jgi:hypothetical protein
VVAKGAPLLGKAIPVLSIAIDVVSIVNTWKSNNETLGNITKLKTDLSTNIQAFRDAVKAYQKTIEEELGNAALQQSLLKLLRLRKPPGPPMKPEDTCKAMGMMKSMIGVGFMLFVSLIGGYTENKAEDKSKNTGDLKTEDRNKQSLEDKTDHKSENKYAAEFITKADVEALSQKPMCAPVVDSVYEKYPDPKPSEEDKDHHPLQGAWPPVGSAYFRSFCELVDLSSYMVHNAAGTQYDKRGTPWIDFWYYFMDQNGRGYCSDVCRISLEGGEWSPDYHSRDPYVSLGGHMVLRYKTRPDWQYIMPICPSHNAPYGFFDRGGYWMLTKENTYAVKIPPA